MQCLGRIYLTMKDRISSYNDETSEVRIVTLLIPNFDCPHSRLLKYANFNQDSIQLTRALQRMELKHAQTRTINFKYYNLGNVFLGLQIKKSRALKLG